MREHKAMHDENFLSSWLREDLVGIEEREGIRERTRQKRRKAEVETERGERRRGNCCCKKQVCQSLFQ